MSGASRSAAALRRLLPTRCSSFRSVVATLEKTLDFDISLFLCGESGTGKDFVAEAVHRCSSRRDGPFVRIDCAGIPADLFESELFGFEKGTFTDASARKAGRLELAAGGTLYLDGVGNIPALLQAKLLRVIEDKRFTRLGSSQPILLDARIITSALGAAGTLLESGGLRNDLYYRLSVVSVELPPLRDRLEDVEMLAARFLELSAARNSNAISGFEPEVIEVFHAYEWPGNVRELMSVVDRAVTLSSGERITASDLPFEKFFTPDRVATLGARGGWSLEDVEKRYIRAILDQNGGNNSRAAKVLGINRKTLLEKRKKYGLG